jgi:hypothetical protein
MASFSPLKLLLITLSIVSATVAQYGAMQIAEGQIAEGLSPRYYLGLSPQPQLARRDGSCAATSHTCTSPLSSPLHLLTKNRSRCR